MKEKNLSLELVKFFAVIAVANHWMAPLYVKWGMLATGGTIGDCLFFFASGYTIFLGRFDRFDNWYKRRIKRIFPSVIAFSSIVSILDIEQLTITEVITGGRYWFIKCIMIYYFILYLVRKYAASKPMYPIVIYSIIVFVWYLCEDSSKLFMYGETFFRWACFFIFMLTGAYLGNKTFILKSKPLYDVPMLFVFLAFFYGIQILARRSVIISHFQILTLIPLMGIILCLYKISINENVVTFLRTKLGLCLRFVAGLCLEAYIVSKVVINYLAGALFNLFPLSLIGTFLMILVIAYLTRCLARVFIQIFEKDDFDWKSIVRAV